MKKLYRFLTYVLVFLVGFAAAMSIFTFFGTPARKLGQLEQLITQCFIGEADTKVMEDHAASAIVSSLGDRWSYYVTAEDYETLLEQQENAYVGIGITIMADEEEVGFRILAVQENGTAQKAGLLSDDRIISADGQSMDGLSVEDLRNIVRGKEGTTVHLVVVRDGQELEFDVPRAKILTEVVKSQLLEGNIGLITIANFDSRCASESIAAIESLREQGATSLIFDVRNNPGGYAHEMVALLDYLLPEGDLFRTVDYKGNESVDRSDASFLDMPMVVLCNEDSYSAAEFFAAAIAEYEAGTVIGMPTCGKGYFQYTYRLSDGSAVGLSVGKYYTPNGKSLAEVGIQPDITVDVDDDTYAKIYYGQLDPMEDPQILAAMEVLK